MVVVTNKTTHFRHIKILHVPWERPGAFFRKADPSLINSSHTVLPPTGTLRIATNKLQ